MIWRHHVKSTQIFLGYHLRYFRVASTQIFFRVVAWKKLGVILINQKKISWAPWKKCYPRKSQVAPYKNPPPLISFILPMKITEMYIAQRPLSPVPHWRSHYLIPLWLRFLPPFLYSRASDRREHLKRIWAIDEMLSIGDWVLCKRGLDGDNSSLKFLFNFRKRKLHIF